MRRVFFKKKKLKILINDDNYVDNTQRQILCELKMFTLNILYKINRFFLN